MARAEKATMRQEQAAETKQKLLDSARKLFAERGFSGTPVRSINRSVGLADGLLYHYFPGGKKEIFQVIVEESFRRILEEIHQRSLEDNFDGIPLETVLEQVYRNFAEILRDNLDIFKIFFREGEVREFISWDEIDSILKNRYRWLPELLKQRAEAGEIREMDYESAADTIIALMINHLMAKLVGIVPPHLSDPQQRARLIRYQVSLWKIPRP